MGSQNRILIRRREKRGGITLIKNINNRFRTIRCLERAVTNSKFVGVVRRNERRIQAD